MDYILSIGIIGSLVLLMGAAWPEPKSPLAPIKSWKNRFFALGTLLMFFYAFLNYQAGASIFFLILEILLLIATALMFLNLPDKIDFLFISISSFGLIAWSLFLFEDYSTILFILGLAAVGLGYAFRSGTVRRNAALAGGSLLIAIFSYLTAAWVFFFLNLFFALFSAYYVYLGLLKQNRSNKN